MAGIALHEDVNTEKIPDPVVKPTLTGVKMKAENVNVLVLDIETTGLRDKQLGQTPGTNHTLRSLQSDTCLKDLHSQSLSCHKSAVRKLRE